MVQSLDNQRGTGTRARSRDFNQSLGRGLEIIETFGPDAPRQTVSEVAAKTGLTRATARRFLITLVELGYMTSDGRPFSLAPRVLGLGYSFLSGLGFPNVALPHLEQLVAEVDESSEASILDGHDVVYVTRVPGPKLLPIAVNIGYRIPVSPTLTWSLPATMTDSAAFLREVLRARADGFAVVDQGLEEGLLAVAVP